MCPSSHSAREGGPSVLKRRFVNQRISARRGQRLHQLGVRSQGRSSTDGVALSSFSRVFGRFASSVNVALDPASRRVGEKPLVKRRG
jgi:hypothetical protein